MFTNCSVALSFKQKVECFFLICANVLGKTLDVDFSLCIILDRDGRPILFMSWNVAQQIKHQLIVNFDIGHSNSDLLVKLRSNLLEHLRNSSWNDTSVLVILGRT